MAPPPPPVTPSPHRFVIKKPKRAPQYHQTPLASSTQQFNAAPRFNFAPNNNTDVSYRAETPLAQHSTHARPRDVIEEIAQGTGFDTYETLESRETSFLQEHLSADEDDEYGLGRRSSKRRRLSPSPILDSQDQDLGEPPHENVGDNLQRTHSDFEDFIPSAHSTISSPPAEPLQRPPPGSITAPRFLLPSTPAPFLPSTPGTRQKAIFVKPPRFRPPDGQEQQQRPIEPLPDAFSPQRRGQRFLAGGLAAEVTGWIMNLEINAPANSTRPNEDTWVMELVVDEVRGGPSARMTLVSGRLVHTAQSGQGGGMVDASGIVKIILAGSGTSDGFQKASRVVVRKKIRVKSPIWEVSIERETWGVAVTWDVLS